MEFVFSAPLLRTSGRLVRLSTDDRPATVDDDGGTLQVGQELLDEDTGVLTYWTGTAWERPTAGQKLQQLIDVMTDVRDSLKTKAE